MTRGGFEMERQRAILNERRKWLVIWIWSAGGWGVRMERQIKSRVCFFYVCGEACTESQDYPVLKKSLWWREEQYCPYNKISQQNYIQREWKGGWGEQKINLKSHCGAWEDDRLWQWLWEWVWIFGRQSIQMRREEAQNLERPSTSRGEESQDHKVCKSKQTPGE